MKRTLSALALTFLLASCNWNPSSDQDSQASSSSSSASSIANDLITVSEPLADAVVASPLMVIGEARGTWYFEASFPVRLFDANGNEIAVAPAQAQDDWMTEDFVPFEVTLTFSPPATQTGTLVLEKDNPSGLPEHAASIMIPVMFW